MRFLLIVALFSSTSSQVFAETFEFTPNEHTFADWHTTGQSPIEIWVTVRHRDLETPLDMDHSIFSKMIGASSDTVIAEAGRVVTTFNEAIQRARKNGQRLSFDLGVSATSKDALSPVGPAFDPNDIWIERFQKIERRLHKIEVKTWIWNDEDR